MGIISTILAGGATALGRTVQDVTEVFRPNANRQMELEHEAFGDALSQYSEEFASPGSSWFDSAINGLNRLPRPMLALGTLGLFVFSMVDPIGFSARMEGLAYVPDPLWWLLGAIVSFYFGARELHYARRGPKPARPRPAVPAKRTRRRQESTGDNPALNAWRRNKQP